MYSIYKVTNTKNDKVYVGRTKIGIVERLGQHLGKARLNKEYDKNNKFHEAIRELGEESFKVELLAQTENLDEANSLEIKFIKELNSLYPNGYNMTKGGTYNEEGLKNKYKNKNIDFKGEKNPFFGKKHTEETRKRMSKSWEERKKREVGKTSYRFLQNISKEKRQEMIEKNKNNIPFVLCDYKTGKIIKEYFCASECARELYKEFNDNKKNITGGNIVNGLSSNHIYYVDNNMCYVCKKEDYSIEYFKNRIKNDLKSFIKNLPFEVENTLTKEKIFFKTTKEFYDKFNAKPSWLEKKELFNKKIFIKKVTNKGTGKIVDLGEWKFIAIFPDYY